jgi:hypothetical protein
VVALQGDHAVYLRAEAAPNWAAYGPWQGLGGYMQAVRVETDSWGDLQVVALGADGALYVNGQSSPTSAAFSGWQSLYGHADGLGVAPGVA